MKEKNQMTIWGEISPFHSVPTLCFPKTIVHDLLDSFVHLGHADETDVWKGEASLCLFQEMS